MSPGGHFITTAIACGASWLSTESVPLTAGLAAGGFLIDVDHLTDYVLVERGRRLTPAAFLRHYISGRVERTVLALHSYELMVLLCALTWWIESPWLAGFLVGAAMHLALDLVFNGRLVPNDILAFYCFSYRWAHRFEARALLGELSLETPPGFWSQFFLGARPGRSRVRAAVAPVPHTVRG